MHIQTSLLEHAADLIAQADAIVVACGAGMGVDSGLPDFRGSEGLWKAYPALGRERIEFHRIASPMAFRTEPLLAWGFYGHRLNLYRRTEPHAGFGLLRRWGDQMFFGAGVFTSNVDGHFQLASTSWGLVEECHGSIHHLQCLDACSEAVWTADEFHPVVDEVECRLLNNPPTCPRCGALARPNVMMFNDHEWLEHRQAGQARALEAWLQLVERPVVVEVGAGTAIPTVRHFSHQILHRYAGRLIRINPLDCTVPTPRDVGIQLRALEALQLLESALADRW
ncbi:SIR2 family NAD-dependent protein deacylase [Hydrogenophaga atypica]|uniref:protein acetyllysine N-acetyltransferase n=1 Tax=Hydrogenophaga atypica TaxID=249409 RepID=A0ABW2QLH6_9BURK